MMPSTHETNTYIFRFALPKLKLSHNASCGAYRIAAWFFAGFEMNST